MFSSKLEATLNVTGSLPANVSEISSYPLGYDLSLTSSDSVVVPSSEVLAPPAEAGVQLPILAVVPIAISTEQTVLVRMLHPFSSALFQAFATIFIIHCILHHFVIENWVKAEWLDQEVSLAQFEDAEDEDEDEVRRRQDVKKEQEVKLAKIEIKGLFNLHKEAQAACGRSVLEARKIQEMQERVDYIQQVQLKMLEDERQEMVELNRVLWEKVENFEQSRKTNNTTQYPRASFVQHQPVLPH